MLSPKRTKFRKQHRGRLNGKATRGNLITFVNCSLNERNDPSEDNSKNTFYGELGNQFIEPFINYDLVDGAHESLTIGLEHLKKKVSESKTTLGHTLGPIFFVCGVSVGLVFMTRNPRTQIPLEFFSPTQTIRSADNIPDRLERKLSYSYSYSSSSSENVEIEKNNSNFSVLDEAVSRSPLPLASLTNRQKLKPKVEPTPQIESRPVDETLKPRRLAVAPKLTEKQQEKINTINRKERIEDQALRQANVDSINEVLTSQTGSYVILADGKIRDRQEVILTRDHDLKCIFSITRDLSDPKGDWTKRVMQDPSRLETFSGSNNPRTEYDAEDEAKAELEHIQRLRNRASGSGFA